VVITDHNNVFFGRNRFGLRVLGRLGSREVETNILLILTLYLYSNVSHNATGYSQGCHLFAPENSKASHHICSHYSFHKLGWHSRSFCSFKRRYFVSTLGRKILHLFQFKRNILSQYLISCRRSWPSGSPPKALRFGAPRVE
jgi:hypothetical protein